VKRCRPARGGTAAAAARSLALPLLFLVEAAAGADVEAGRQKAQVCVACHGPAGNSTNPVMPSLAGQPAQFISTELFQFREGHRKDPQMTPMAAKLSNADLSDLAAYFSAQKLAPPAHKTDPANAAAAPKLARQFNCVQCHGPALLGLQHIPRLAGQQFEYLNTQMRAFKAQTRADLDGNMTSAAQALTDKEIDVLVDYIAGLGAP
jgi:cytochrome c553